MSMHVSQLTDIPREDLLSWNLSTLHSYFTNLRGIYPLGTLVGSNITVSCLFMLRIHEEISLSLSGGSQVSMYVSQLTDIPRKDLLSWNLSTLYISLTTLRDIISVLIILATETGELILVLATVIGNE